MAGAAGAFGLPHDPRVLAKLAVAGLTMIGQRIPEAFFATALPAIYRDKGFDLENFWLFGLLYLPSCLKFLWAPFVDRWTISKLGRRRSWILCCAAGLSLCFLILAMMEPTLDNMTAVVGMMLLTGFIFATGDIALDTYIIESFEPDEQPYGGALSRFADALVAFIVVGGLLWVLDFMSWPAAISTGAVLIAILCSCILLRPEPEMPAQAEVLAAQGRQASLLRSLKQKHLWYVLPLATLTCAVMFMLIQAPSAFLVDIGFDLGEVGYALGIPQAIAGLLGAVAAAMTINAKGIKTSAWIFVVVMLVGVFAMLRLSLAETPSMTELSISIFIWGFASPIFIVLLLTALFSWADKAQTATDFTLMNSFAFLGIFLAPGLYGFIAGQFSWTVFYIVGAVMVMITGAAFAFVINPVQRLVDERNAGHASRSNS
jgi:MFS family permease